MREVEVQLKGWKLADAMGELRKWLDHNDCVPISFDITRGKRRVLVLRMAFAEDHLAEAFRRHFGGLTSTLPRLIGIYPRSKVTSPRNASAHARASLSILNSTRHVTLCSSVVHRNVIRFKTMAV